jgi:hypothetical protein
MPVESRLVVQVSRYFKNGSGAVSQYIVVPEPGNGPGAEVL